MHSLRVMNIDIFGERALLPDSCIKSLFQPGDLHCQVISCYIWAETLCLFQCLNPVINLFSLHFVHLHIHGTRKLGVSHEVIFPADQTRLENIWRSGSINHSLNKLSSLTTDLKTAVSEWNSTWMAIASLML